MTRLFTTTAPPVLSTVRWGCTLAYVERPTTLPLSIFISISSSSSSSNRWGTVKSFVCKKKKNTSVA